MRMLPTYESLPFSRNAGFLVTGAAGFIGSNLVEALCRMGYGVRGLDNYVNGRRETIAALKKQYAFDFIEGDIRDESVCRRACRNIDYVLHQAAWSGDARSISLPAVYDSNNVHGTVCLLDAAVHADVTRFVYASSPSVYGDSALIPRSEDAEGDCLSPYALSKKICEEYAVFYRRQYGLDTIGLRYFNVFGRSENLCSPLASFITLHIDCLLRGEGPVIPDNGSGKVHFTYIDNAIEANLRACLAPPEACGQAYNIADEQPVSILELSREIRRLMDVNIAPVYKQHISDGIPNLTASIAKARRNIGYNPQFDTWEGLAETISWYKSRRTEKRKVPPA